MTLLLILAAIAAMALLAVYICFRLVFYAKPRKPAPPDHIDIPEGEIYEVYREDMIEWTRAIRSMPHEDMEITSFDGLKLRGRYYEHSKGAPIEILLHGYRGNSERDLSGGIFRCFALGRSVLLIDHRASGRSEGNVITFGVNESRDCRDWVDFVLENIDKDATIFIGGVSMGASTAMMVTARDLPKNVVGILADCGYSSTKRIIKKVVREMHLPADVLYPLIKLGARLFGHFDLEELSPEDAMKNCHLPVIFLHGDTDDFVPFEMSVESYDACASEHKKLVKIEGAGHGLAFPAAQERYIKEVGDFFDEALGKKN
jgi:fermentation-respiration switch protein FrsA (DUF1100 family)